MINKRASALYVVTGFVLGVVFSSIYIARFDVAGLPSAGNISRLLCTFYKSEDTAVRRNSRESEEISVERPFESERKDGDGLSAPNVSVISTIDKIPGCELLHQDHTLVARQLQRQVRVLCWIMTSPATLKSRASHVRATWGKRCDVLLFASDYKNKKFPTIDITVPHGRDHLAMKTTKTFDYVYTHHRDEADWFLKADDDTYVIMENLRYMLSQYNPLEALSFGHAFDVETRFFSGGAGYVISREALNRWAHRPPGRCPEDGDREDVVMCDCLASLGVKAQDTRDSHGRHRFIPSTVMQQLTHKISKWNRAHNAYKHNQEGMDSVSHYPVSFHYVKSSEMYEIEYFMYRAHAYGIVGGLEAVNTIGAPSNESTKSVLSSTEAKKNLT